MTELLPIVLTLEAFFSTVVVPCVTIPENWEHCREIDQWLIPELVRGYELYTGREVPYGAEHDILGGYVHPLHP